MGKKKSKSKSSSATPALAEPQVDDDLDVDQADLAAQLLADMGISSEPETQTQSEIQSGSTQIEPSKFKPNDFEHKKRNRRKEKLARRDKETADMVAEAERSSQSEPNRRQNEIEAIERAIAPHNLVVQEITPDGHCLFSSIADQFQQKYDIELSVQELRQNASEFIKSHADDFSPFLLDETTGEVKDIDDYTEKLEKTSMWGGNIEIIALSRRFDCPIQVFMASQPTMVVGDVSEKKPLSIAYYRDIYGLGAHYNSLRDK